MEPIVMIMVPGFLGGLLIAWLFVRLQRQRPSRPDTSPLPDEPLSTDVINMARIRVAGVGGLGFVAMALVIAWAVPRIGQTVAAGFVLGVAFAVVLILARRRKGPMPTAGRRPGAHSALWGDAPSPEDDTTGRRPPISRRAASAPTTGPPDAA